MRTPANKRAILQALFVTFLWSTSWVLIKVGLKEIPPLTFAGLRYAIACAILLPGLWRRRAEVRALTRTHWAQLIALGIAFYALTQGGQFLTLNHLDAIPFSLILSFTPLLVAVGGTFALREIPARLQWFGIALVLVGAAVYFAPSDTLRGSGIGFVLAGLTLCANTMASLLGRLVNRRRIASPLVVTAISMGIGAACLLGAGMGTQGVPVLTLRAWGIVLWLAIVNTAVAFTLWNRTLRTLSATESSVINNTMMIQIAVLAWVFLGETLGAVEIVGLLMAVCGTLLVQFRRARIVDTGVDADESSERGG
ncbi:MAG: EamA family transporter [Candidatus Bipolaricaulia bacterium]